MLRWRYQIVRRDDWDDKSYALHEGFIEDDISAEVSSVTADPVDFVAESKADLVEMLRQALADATAHDAVSMTDIIERAGAWVASVIGGNEA